VIVIQGLALMKLIEKSDSSAAVYMCLLVPRGVGIAYGRESEINSVPFIHT
jgi:hypothetical protein